MSVQISQDALLTLLQERFGHAEFRPGQEQTIRALLAGHDVLAVLPTGGGKSLVYQLTALLLPGVTLVVSPLLALMKDQIETLEEHGVGVESVSSQDSATDTADALADVQEHGSKLLYVTPERLENPAFMAQLEHTQVSLLVIDEAHCASQWGHNFRPAYLGLAVAAKRLGSPTMLALTATANPWVRQDIVRALGLRDPVVLVYGTDRPNLFFEVERAEDESGEYRLLERLLREPAGDAETSEDEEGGLGAELRDALRGSGIIYVATTRAARETAGWLRDWGISADYYHGQRKAADRARVQEAFMRGEVRVIAATNAFGLGVDKPDVRFVIHRDVPASVEAYSQEAGRAGRDGALARCTLLYRPADLGQAAFLAGGGALTVEDVRQAHTALLAHPGSTRRELAASSGLGHTGLARVLALLRDAGLVRERRGRVYLAVPDFDPAVVPLEREEHRRAYEHSRLDMMRAYAELADCRRRFLLNYFGEEQETPYCGRCDNCLRQAERAAAAVSRPPTVGEPAFAVNARVRHPVWGVGIVPRQVGDAITVLFESEGYKTLRADIVREQALLRPLPNGSTAEEFD